MLTNVLAYNKARHPLKTNNHGFIGEDGNGGKLWLYMRKEKL